MASVLVDNSKILNTICEMLIERGYDNDYLEDYYKMDLNDLSELIKSGDFHLLVKHTKENKYAVVHIFNFMGRYKAETKLKKEDIVLVINQLKNTMEKGYYYDLILVSKDPLNSQVMSRLNDINNSNNTDPQEKMIHVETLIHDELKYNISKHFLAFKHSKASKEEVEKLYTKYNISSSGLPLINHNDPQCKYIGLRQGDVCRIERISPTTGKYIYYRYVI